MRRGNTNHGNYGMRERSLLQNDNHDACMTPPAKMENIGENIGPVMNIFCGYIIKCEAQTIKYLAII